MRILLVLSIKLRTKTHTRDPGWDINDEQYSGPQDIQVQMLPFNELGVAICLIIPVVF